jgi:hypothetical protein
MPKARLGCNWQLIQGVVVSQMGQLDGEGNVFPSPEGKLVPEHPPSPNRRNLNRGGDGYAPPDQTPLRQTRAPPGEERPSRSFQVGSQFCPARPQRRCSSENPLPHSCQRFHQVRLREPGIGVQPC